jgi:hypothetical protein
MTQIDPSEVALTGRWRETPDGVQADDVARRIEALTTSYLRAVAHASNGWSVLYEDPADGRYWELTYPMSDMHGGGPPSLIAIDPSDARERYNLPWLKPK